MLYMSSFPSSTRYRQQSGIIYRIAYVTQFGCCNGYQRIGNAMSCRRLRKLILNPIEADGVRFPPSGYIYYALIDNLMHA